MDSDAAKCGICGEPVREAPEADLHRTRHHVPTRVVAFPECHHPPLFVDLRFGKVQIAPLVVDATTRRIPREPWDSDTLPVPVRRVLEVQNLRAPEGIGPHFPQDEKSARALDDMYHRLGGSKAVASEATPGAEISEERDGESPEDDGGPEQMGPLEHAVERAMYYRTAPPYGLTDDELVARLLDEASGLDEKDLRKRLFAEGLIDSPHTPTEMAGMRAREIRRKMPSLDDDTLLGMTLREFPGVERDDLRLILAGWSPTGAPEAHGPHTLPELVRLAAAQGRPWDLVERRLRSATSPEEMRALRALFNRTTGLRAIFEGQQGAYWCGKCEHVHYVWTTVGRRHQSREAKHHALEPI